MKFQRTIFLYLFFLFTNTSFIFSQDSLKTAQTPFTKGRSVVALGGNINSATRDRIGRVSDSKKFLNEYSFDISLGKVLANNFLLGLRLSIDRAETEQLVATAAEIMTVGPWARLYLGTSHNGGFFFQGGFLYANYYERNTLFEQFLAIDETIQGDGYAIVGGLGYTYVMKRMVGFEVGFNYRVSNIHAEVIDHISLASDFQTFSRADIMFNFGIILIFNKLKK